LPPADPQPAPGAGPPAPAPAPPGAGRAATAFVFVTVALDMLAFGLVVPVLPRLVEGFLGGDTARAAEWFGLFGTAWALMQFVCQPLLGAVSDRYGRRPVILASNCGLGLDYLVMAMAPGLWWLFAGRVMSGAFAATVSTAFAYIADVTPEEKRAGAFGLVGVAVGLGFVLGPAAGGLLGTLDPRLPFWAAGGLSLLNFLYGLLVLPESLPPERRSAFSWARANPVGAARLILQHRALWRLAMVHGLKQLAHIVFPSVFVLYAGYRFGWDAATLGLTLAAVGVSSAVVQGTLIRPVIRRLGEARSLRLGLLVSVASFTLMGLAPSGPWIWAAIPLMALADIAGPSLQGMATRAVGPQEQGRLQGALGSVQSLSQLIGPAIFTLTFAWAIAPERSVHVPGAAFLLGAALLVVASLLAPRR
jgi:DHA1 family tetracycline resistance protein-like MFS transporter